MNTRGNLVAVFAIAVVLVAACFPAHAADAYRVSLHLSHDGKEFGAPSMVVRSGVAGTTEVSGPDGYRLELVATDAGPGRIKVSAKLDSSHGSMSPEVVVRPGTQATVSAGDLEIALTATSNDDKH